MRNLVVIPTAKEIACFLQSCAGQGIRAESTVVGKLSVTLFPELNMGVALAGLGKAQSAVQTQHLISGCSDVHVVMCAGAAGALSDSVAVGDVVVATETVEHDIRNRFGPPLLPRFPSTVPVIAAFRELSQAAHPFQVHFGPVASGDEDVVDPARRLAIHQATNAIAVAWEGAGVARASQFSDVSFVEIRGITDGADHHAASDFVTNLTQAMGNVAKLITIWARDGNRTAHQMSS
ncbi:MAG: 5'-methylthioadenosine/S-adenosylhomocysteine nucleosidase [Caldilineaceae bacterium]|nr:5'-methylthioadenosine/S-adenosylhomocysteine nucleosidase [Caldilineaceae bacterium]